MAGKDITQKMLEEYRDVFADIVNNLLLDGQELITEESLEEIPGQRSQFRADNGKLHEQERDVSKLWKSEGMIFALIGLENQTTPDPDMPLRIISYEGASYKSQLLSKRRKRGKKKGRRRAKNMPPRYPVVTLVLYFGKEHWNGPRKLSDRMRVRRELTPYFNDHKINVVEVSYLSDEQINCFKSDFRILAEWCVKSRTDPGYEPTDWVIAHVDALLKALSALSGDRRYEEISAAFQGMESEGVTMCDVLDVREARGFAKGENRLAALISYLMKHGLNEELEEALESEDKRQEYYRQFGIAG